MQPAIIIGLPSFFNSLILFLILSSVFPFTMHVLRIIMSAISGLDVFSRPACERRADIISVLFLFAVHPYVSIYKKFGVLILIFCIFRNVKIVNVSDIDGF